MDSDNVACPSCGTRYRFSPEIAGRAVQCSRCGDVFLMPVVGRRKGRRTRPPEAPEQRPRVTIANDESGGAASRKPARGGPPQSAEARAGRADGSAAHERGRDASETRRRAADAGGR